MPTKTTTKASIASILPLRMVGPGYMVLRRPEQFVAIFRIRGGICPWNDSPETINYKLSGLSSAFMQLRPDEEVQIFSRRVPLKAETAVQRYESQIKEDSPEVYRKGYANFFKSWLKEFVEGNKLSEYESYVLFTIRPGGGQGEKRLLNLMGLKKETSSSVSLEDVIRRARAWAALLSGSGASIEDMKEEDIYRLLFEELTLGTLNFNPKVFNRGALHSAGPEGYKNIREMLATVPWDFSSPDNYKVGKKYGRVLPVSEFPDMENYPLFLSSLYQQPHDFRVSLYVRGIEQEKAKLRIERQMKRDQSTADKGAIQNFDSIASFQERQAVMHQLSRRETSLCRFSLYVNLVCEDPETLQTASDSVSRYFSNFHRFEGYFEQMDLFRSCLPMARNIPQHHLHLTSTENLRNCVNFFTDPLVQGGGVPMGTSQGMQLVTINPWGENLSNWNTGVFGIAGKGKSFGISQLIIRLMPLNPYVMIVDASRSYEFLCRTAGGRYLKLGLKNPDSSINVFEMDPEELKANKGSVDPELVSNILGFLNVICTDTGEAGLPNLDLSIMEDAVKRTYKRTCTKKGEEAVPILRDLQETLVEMGKEKEKPEEFVYICKKYAEILKPYIGDGIYANLTDRRTNVRGESSFIVFDTYDLPDDEKLKALAVYIVAQYCLVKSKKNKTLNRKSLFILDEAWTLAQFVSGKQFLLRVAKTSRHLALASIYATQQVSDLLKDADVKPLLDNASLKILFGLGDSDVAAAAELMELNPTESANLRNLRQLRGLYSQALLVSSGQRGVLNITPDDLSLVISTTYPPERTNRDHYIKKYAPNGEPESLFAALALWADHRRQGTVEKD